MLRDFPEEVLEAVLLSYGIPPQGTALDKMLQLIVFRYEYAEARYNIFKAFCIDFRTKCRTFVELTQWDKLDQAFTLIDNLSTDITDEQIEQLYNDFNAL
jgi:hypothetical protein